MERKDAAPQGSRIGQGRRGDVPLCELQKLETAVELHWFKPATGQWCALDAVDLEALENRYGVFVIWRNADTAKVSTLLYVGRGRLKSELATCRRSPLFASPRLLVTWAEIDDPADIDGIATYLYQQLRPIWGEIVSSALPLPVNLPLTA